MYGCGSQPVGDSSAGDRPLSRAMGIGDRACSETTGCAPSSLSDREDCMEMEGNSSALCGTDWCRAAINGWALQPIGTIINDNGHASPAEFDY